MKEGEEALFTGDEDFEYEQREQMDQYVLNDVGKIKLTYYTSDARYKIMLGRDISQYNERKKYIFDIFDNDNDVDHYWS